MFAKNCIPEKELLSHTPPDCMFAVRLPTIGDEVFVASNALNKHNQHKPQEGSAFSPAIVAKKKKPLSGNGARKAKVHHFWEAQSKTS